MKEIFLGLLSIGMVTSYITSAFYCGLNLWYNKDVIHPLIKQAFLFYFVATIAMIICGTDWIIHRDYMKIPTWQALGWGIMHITMPTGFYLINSWICETSSIMKCNMIRDKFFDSIKIENQQKDLVHVEIKN